MFSHTDKSIKTQNQKSYIQKILDKFQIRGHWKKCILQTDLFPQTVSSNLKNNTEETYRSNQWFGFTGMLKC